MASVCALSASDQQRLVAALARRAIDRDGAAPATVIETHISYVLLTGRHAYKIKKAVALGFLDFSTLEARRRCCADELALNRRLAPELYLDVVPITGTADEPRLAGDGPPIEYAVRMREFAQDALASRLLARGGLGASDIDSLAAIVAAFHRCNAVAPANGDFGAPQQILAFALQNFEQLAALPGADDARARLDALQEWTRREYARRERVFEARRRGGFVRECHGDLHLNNIARVDGKLVIFDCLEFNAQLRWIDTMSEIAFVAMDLDDRGRPDLARRFRNAYLEHTGDYAALAVYRFYYVYRALVRAKVAALRESQVDQGRVHDALDREIHGYIDLAARAASPTRPAIVVMHGLSGSGKSTLAHALAQSSDAIRLRTDIERKRMYGLAAEGRSGSAAGAGLYRDEANHAVYERVAELARAVVDAGNAVLVDGACLARWQRDRFRDLAAELCVPFVVLSLVAPSHTLCERITGRLQHAADASEADLTVLEHQQRIAQPLDADERQYAIVCDGVATWEQSRVDALLHEITARGESA